MKEGKKKKGRESRKGGKNATIGKSQKKGETNEASQKERRH